MPDRAAALASAFLVEPVDPSCAAWFATCKAANSPYARRELAMERDRRDASVGDALQALASEFRHLLEPHWGSYLDDEEQDYATRACLSLLEEALWELETRGGGSLPERLALAREIEAKLTGAVLRDSPLRAPIHEACLRFHGAL